MRATAIVRIKSNDPRHRYPQAACLYLQHQQHVDWHAFRRRRQVRQLQQQSGAIGNRFAQTHNAAGAHFNPRFTDFFQRVEALPDRYG